MSAQTPRGRRPEADTLARGHAPRSSSSSPSRPTVATSAVAQAAPLTAAAPIQEDVNGDWIRSNNLNTRLDIGTVRTPAAGVVQVYDYRDGAQGEPVGSEPLRAGVNRYVRVGWDAPRPHETLVVFTIGGEVVGRQVVNLASDD